MRFEGKRRQAGVVECIEGREELTGILGEARKSLGSCEEEKTEAAGWKEWK